MKLIQKKGYHRKKYLRKDGTIVSATYVPPTSFLIKGKRSTRAKADMRYLENHRVKQICGATARKVA